MNLTGGQFFKTKKKRRYSPISLSETAHKMFYWSFVLNKVNLETLPKQLSLLIYTIKYSYSWFSLMHVFPFRFRDPTLIVN